MSARKRLNRLHLSGDILLAGVVGMLMQSWPALFLTLAVLVGLDLYTGDVRPQTHGRRHLRRGAGQPVRKEERHEK